MGFHFCPLMKALRFDHVGINVLALSAAIAFFVKGLTAMLKEKHDMELVG